MTDQELKDFAADESKVHAETDSEREKFQVEICKREGQRFILPDGSVAYQPPDWKVP